MELDKRSPIPLYYQLAELIKEQIRAGELKPGDQLPSERDLSEKTSVSRMTVRQALTYLVREGTLVVKSGIGTFVAEPKLTYDALHLLGFTEEMMRQGGAVASRVLEQTLVMPPPHVADKLALKPGETAVKIVRLRLYKEMPLVLETIYVPAKLCPGLEHEDLETHSLYVLMERHYRLHLSNARQTLEAITANEYESTHFDIRAGMPMIMLEGVTFLDQGAPAEYFKAIYRGDRFKFALESQRDVAPEGADASRVSVVLS